MLLLTGVGVALMLGLARGGRLTNIAALPLRATWLPAACFALQLVLVQLRMIVNDTGWGLAAAALVASYAVLIGFLAANRLLPGVKLIVLGAALNLAVMVANGGHMPVTMEALERAGHADRVVMRGGRAFVSGTKDVVLDRDDTRLYPLSDTLGIPSGYPLPTNFSFGDVAIAFGAALLAYGAVSRRSTRSFQADSLRTGFSPGWFTPAREGTDA